MWCPQRCPSWTDDSPCGAGAVIRKDRMYSAVLALPTCYYARHTRWRCKTHNCSFDMFHRSIQVVGSRAARLRVYGLSHAAQDQIPDNATKSIDMIAFSASTEKKNYTRSVCRKIDGELYRYIVHAFINTPNFQRTSRRCRYRCALTAHGFFLAVLSAAR